MRSAMGYGRINADEEIVYSLSNSKACQGPFGIKFRRAQTEHISPGLLSANSGPRRQCSE